MTKRDDPLVLAGEFPEATREQWLERVARVLSRGAPAPPDACVLDRLFEKRLVSHSYDGIAIQPLYTDDDALDRDALASPFVRGQGATHGGWDVRVHVEVRDDGSETAERIRHELERGATSIVLGLRDVDTIDAETLERALEGVQLGLITLVADAGPRAVEIAHELALLYDGRNVPAEDRRCVIGADPIGEYAVAGGVRPLGLDDAASLAAHVAGRLPHLRTIVVDAARYADAGGADADELALALATGVAYLRALTEAGLDPDAACGQLEFRFAATADQFATIAKLRAARRAWARVAEVAGASEPARAQRQHAISSRAMTSLYDPWVNMLRGTVACFAAGVGGADAVTVHPYDVLGGPARPTGELGRRMARNTQAILIDESHAARVADPAGGSHYVERLTDQLAQAAWPIFQAIEAAGGIVAALERGAVQERLRTTWEERARNIARRRDPITGVSEFPDIDEEIALPAPEAAPPRGDTAFEPVTAVRYPQPFEDQRLRADRRGERPRMFLAALGPPAVHNARARFAKNLFEAAGIRATDPEGGYEDASAAASAFAASGARLACICSSDERYAEDAAPTAQALKRAGAQRVYLAGRHEADGVDERVHAGVDALDVLTRALDELGVPG